MKTDIYDIAIIWLNMYFEDKVIDNYNDNINISDDDSDIQLITTRKDYSIVFIQSIVFHEFKKFFDVKLSTFYNIILKWLLVTYNIELNDADLLYDDNID